MHAVGIAGTEGGVVVAFEPAVGYAWPLSFVSFVQGHSQWDGLAYIVKQDVKMGVVKWLNVSVTSSRTSR